MIEVDALHQVLEVLGAGGHPLEVLELDGLHQLIAGRAGRSAPSGLGDAD
ncbi:hypothetical protein ACEPTO_12925 [Pseudomonas aeruginosa]